MSALNTLPKTINIIVIAAFLIFLIAVAYSSNLSACQQLVIRVMRSREMASRRPLSYQITHHAECQCSISHEQYCLPREYSIIHNHKDPVSSQVPHYSTTVQALTVCPHFRQAPQSNHVPPFKTISYWSAYGQQGCPQHTQKIAICDQSPFNTHGYCDLDPGIYRRVQSEKHAERTSGNKSVGLDDPGLRESTPIEISLGTYFALYRRTVGNCSSR